MSNRISEKGLLRLQNSIEEGTWEQILDTCMGLGPAQKRGACFRRTLKVHLETSLHPHWHEWVRGDSWHPGVFLGKNRKWPEAPSSLLHTIDKGLSSPMY